MRFFFYTKHNTANQMRIDLNLFFASYVDAIKAGFISSLLTNHPARGANKFSELKIAQENLLFLLTLQF